MIYLSKTKKNGFAPIIIVLLVVVSVGAIGGVTYFIKSNASDSKNPQSESSDSQRTIEQKEDFQADNFLTGTADDLVVGETIMVRGTENQDGSITANMITIGALEDEIELKDKPEFSPDAERDFSNRSMPEGFDPEEFQNLSQEERMKRMQEMRANAGGDFRARGDRMAGNSAFVRGEIIDKDEISITVKLTDSGSKLIFYSDDTEIRIQE